MNQAAGQRKFLFNLGDALGILLVRIADGYHSLRCSPSLAARPVNALERAGAQVRFQYVRSESLSDLVRSV